jgi:hypothetical protein
MTNLLSSLKTIGELSSDDVSTEYEKFSLFQSVLDLAAVGFWEVCN